MPARTGQEYIEALNERAIRVEIEGECYTGRVAEIPQLRNVVRTYAELFDLQHDPVLPRHPHLRLADERRPGRNVIPPAAVGRRRRPTARGDARLGRALARPPRPDGRLLQRLDRGHGGGR